MKKLSFTITILLILCIILTSCRSSDLTSGTSQVTVADTRFVQFATYDDVDIVKDRNTNILYIRSTTNNGFYVYSVLYDKIGKPATEATFQK